MAQMIVALTACVGEVAPDAESAALASRLDGAWHVSLTLERSPGPSIEPGQALGGSIAIIATARAERNRWLRHETSHAGVADIDFAALGLPWRSGAIRSSLVATVVAPDSVLLVLPADMADGVVLVRATIANDTIRGNWSYEARSTGGWGGRVALWRK